MDLAKGALCLGVTLLVCLRLRSVTIVASEYEPYIYTFRNETNASYLIGTGIYDVTAACAEINFMGYARANQNGHGIHQRLRARAFVMSEPYGAPSAVHDASRPHSHEIVERLGSRSRPDHYPRHISRQGRVEDQANKEALSVLADPARTVCFVSVDIGMGSDLLTQRVIARLEELLPIQDGFDKRLCHLDNLSISGTHTHSAPGGFLQYALYQITSLGFFEEVLEVYVEGVAQAIRRAYDNLQVGSIAVAQERLQGASINRSPSSYLLNPVEERDLYVEDGDTDKRMLQLNFLNANEKPIGALNWFAVHGTSMNSSNRLITGDNKGYASYLMEKHFNENGTLPGKGQFVAAFASTNLGDVSPNTAGPRCIDTGLPCDYYTSTCNGRTELCIAFGPGKNMIESMEIIGRKQYVLASALLGTSNVKKLKGRVASRHSFINMANLTVRMNNTTFARTCPAALGYSFAAGTTDGPGDFDFTQGTNTSNCIWDIIGGFLSTPSTEQIQCHAPKPILLNTGEASLPYAWDPNIVPISVFRIGSLFILNVPGELTTMAGRRLRKAVNEVVRSNGVADPIIAIAGLANSYTHYVTTFEEYSGQRYEAASTLYGPHTLNGYIQEFRRITLDLLINRASASTKAPTDLTRKQITVIPPVELDTIGLGRKFGSVAVDSKDQYIRGNDTVVVSFRSANPRNNPRIEGTFLSIDYLDNDGNWQMQYNDGDWCTRFIWKGGIVRLGSSFAEIHWKIPSDTMRGIYRVCHYGTRKSLLGSAESAIYYAPEWIISNLLGSITANMILQSVKLAIAVSDQIQRFTAGSLGHSRYKEFHGCTRAFLVHDHAN